MRWIGFTNFGDVDDAALVSRTIRYQRDLIRREVADRHGTLEVERAFIERSPDRGTVEVAAEIAASLRKRPDLRPMLVDFAENGNWRAHSPLREALDPMGAEFIAPTPLPSFDPRRHFQDWARRTADHAASKPQHRADVLAAVQGVEDPLAHLNAIGMLTHSGRVWTRDNLRKFLKG